MAQSGMNLYSGSISCSICLDLLKDPVALSCGHSYCMKCIETHWDGEDLKTTYSCPQCRKTFTPRPVLEKNVLLAELVEELKKTGLQAAAADHCYAGPEDVACDVCTGRKMKAFKSCLVCLVSYCDNHLQPHYESPAFKKHQLVEPSKNLQENICSRHDEVMKMIHPTDHEAAERVEKKLEVSRLNIQQRIQDRQKDVKLLQQELKDIRVSADKTVEDSEEMFTQMIHLIQNRSSEVEQQIRSQQETQESRVKELQEKLEQEIRDLERKDAELKQLSDTSDHNQFLHNYPSVSTVSESTHSSSISIRPLRHFEDVTAAVKELRGKVEDVLKDTWTNISPSDVLPPQPEPEPDLEPELVLEPEPEPEPKTRSGFLKYFQGITLDPNTAHTHLVLSEKNRRVTLKDYQNFHPDHPDRFTDWFQVLSRESLTGRCYWEVEWRGGGVYVAVAYKTVRRTGRSRECGFGLDGRSWSLYCDTTRYTFWYNNTKTPVSGRPSSRIGVYLDHSAGVLSFYSILKKMKLLHRVQTTFTEPLHAGLWLYNYGDTAKFIDPQ
ncbi:tripartite motif-containing protein 16-like protein [Acanthochromis polyacanthus]|uniref:tripartite motif-containing protein 16-like protein n=1 Tax=Acanthochromis polyacanthus TaxID=80966 RepID=UPI00223495E6|nr:tripartite motif-containing protein 16-like protein [Acanthochromis polyacanthus]